MRLAMAVVASWVVALGSVCGVRAEPTVSGRAPGFKEAVSQTGREYPSVKLAAQLSLSSFEIRSQRSGMRDFLGTCYLALGTFPLRRLRAIPYR